MPSVEVRAPHDVELARLGRGLAQHLPGGQHQADADRHVDEQAPAPGHPVGEHAADHQADARATGRDQAVETQCLQPLRTFLEGEHQQGQRGRSRDRAADALQDAGAEQQLGGRGETTEQRGRGEHAHARDEDPATAEQVTGPRAEQQETSEGEGIGVLHPGQTGRAEVERVLDLRHRDVHHGAVEDDHQLGDQDDCEDYSRPPRGRAGIGAGRRRGCCRHSVTCSLPRRG